MQFETETHEVVEWLPVPINLVGRPTNGPEKEYTFSQLRDEVSRSDSLNQSKKGGWAIAGEHRPKNGAVPSTARPSHLAGGTDKERELSTRRRRWPRTKAKTAQFREAELDPRACLGWGRSCWRRPQRGRGRK